ncbi:MAG: transposase [Candidatus Omnitrophica bacterium]|nr:transposase [Candidatus Omnitrophota bacterium]
MSHFQLSLFYDIQFLIQNSKFYRKYFLIFKSLDLSSIQDKNYSTGRTGYSRRAMIRSFIVKHLEGIKSVPALIDFLDAHPALTEMCGFNMGSLPDTSQFYRFLSDTNNSTLQNLHHSTIKELLDKNIVSTDVFIVDSKPIMASTRENNFKNPKRNTRNKNRKAKLNPSATLGYYSYQSVSGKKDNFIFFWGYRTHVIVSKEGVPLVELTLPNNVKDSIAARKLIKKLKRIYGASKGSILLADAAYDERAFYNFIVNELKWQAFIPINPRNKQPDKAFGSNNLPLCDAGLEMKFNGIWTENLRTRNKFRCPISASKKFAEHYPAGCPINHQSFNAYGCTKYLDVTDDPRSRVPRESLYYKRTFNLRTEIERYFARLGDRECEQTTHYKIRAVKNQLTIAHLSLSLVAHAAAILIEQPQKIRSYRTFAREPVPCLTA